MTPDEAQAQVYELLDLITSPIAASIYRTHPNDLGADLALHLDGEKSRRTRIPSEWDAWWQWSVKRDDCWKSLVLTSNALDVSVGFETDDVKDSDKHNRAFDGIPDELVRLLSRSKALSLSRQPQVLPVPEFRAPHVSPNGMSPKKHHEVERMTAYVLGLLDTLHEQHGTEIRHIIDIGSGQGYLSTSLCNTRNLHILALDSSSSRDKGSSRRLQQRESRGTLTYRTLWLGREPAFESHPGYRGQGLDNNADFDETVGEWLSSMSTGEEAFATGGAAQRPIPVAFMALHACGSLTPSILQGVLRNRRNSPANGQSWFVATAVVVGCCYNLMGKDDFPLSRTLRKDKEQRFHGFDLSANHLQLAAQVPAQWFRSPNATSATELAMTKILNRALITPLLFRPVSKDSKVSTASRKLGKFNGKAHESFETYLERAGLKLGTDLTTSYNEITMHEPGEVGSSPLARRIKTLHALRCLLGPPVESLIVLDRYLWLQEELGGSCSLDVHLVNLFSQEMGSGRNIGIVLA